MDWFLVLIVLAYMMPLLFIAPHVWRRFRIKKRRPMYKDVVKAMREDRGDDRT